MTKRVLTCLSILLFYAIPLVFSDDRSEIAAIKAFPAAVESVPIPLETRFDTSEDAAQKYPAGYRIAPGEGRNGTAALFYERTDPNVYQLYAVPIKNLLPGKPYVVSAWIRGENLKALGDQKNIGVICVEYSKDGKWIRGGAQYVTSDVGANWQQINLEFTPPVDVAERQAGLTFYLQRKVVGKIWFDDVVVRQTTIPTSVVLTRPDRLSFFGENGRFALRVEDSVPKNSRIVATITNGGKSRDFLLKPNGLDFQGDAGKLEPGPVDIAVKIADRDKKVVIGGETYHLTAYPETLPPKNACTIDEYGRAIVDGKPFMPLGVYGFADEKNYQRLKDAGFNCLALYASLALKGNVDHKDPVKNVQEGLDLIDKYGLKLIFSMTSQLSHNEGAIKEWGEAKGVDAVTELVVKTVKDHPTLLAWYISDEVPLLKVPNIVELRRLISRIDPWHPTWTLTDNHDFLPYYGISGDTIGVDPYPIAHPHEAPKSSSEQSIKHVKTMMTAGRSTGLPVWVVPQIFNWGVFQFRDNPKAFAESYFPTAEEMRAMALYAAMLGAKGFVCYSNHTIFMRYDKLLPGSGEREWPKVVEMVKPIKELEPFILSTKEPLPIAVESEPPDSVEAGILLDDAGNFRVIIIGIGGKTKGTFTLPDNLKSATLRSKFGKTKSLGNGRYEFSVDAVNSDILE